MGEAVLDGAGSFVAHREDEGFPSQIPECTLFIGLLRSRAHGLAKVPRSMNNDRLWWAPWKSSCLPEANDMLIPARSTTVPLSGHSEGVWA